MLAAKASSAASTLSLLAAGETATAMAVTTSYNTAYLHNGVYWYRRTSSAVGFASEAAILLNLADTVSNNCEYRLSWHFGGGAGYGGYRAGCSTGLNSDTTWRKLIFVNNGKRSSFAYCDLLFTSLLAWRCGQGAT
eukprot:1189871-Prorocentrum_minimum.AAC.2